MSDKKEPLAPCPHCGGQGRYSGLDGGKPYCLNACVAVALDRVAAWNKRAPSPRMELERMEAAEAEINRLRAAAPELLQALKLLRSRANETCGASDLMDQVDAAISRAEGR